MCSADEVYSSEANNDDEYLGDIHKTCAVLPVVVYLSLRTEETLLTRNHVCEDD